jgi:hypothetical protein
MCSQEPTHQISSLTGSPALGLPTTIPALSPEALIYKQLEHVPARQESFRSSEASNE